MSAIGGAREVAYAWMFLECSMRNSRMSIANRRGMTALLAMLYLALMASLAVGFYASSNSAVMVSENEKRTNMALMSCESGLDFMNFHLAQLAIPHGGTAQQRMTALYTQLKIQLENTGNMGSKTMSITGTSISIPSQQDQYIKLDPSGSEFHCNIENLSIGEDGKIDVKIIGRFNGYTAKRAVRMNFVLNENPSQIFNYGVATKGTINTMGSARIKGATD